MNCPECKSDNTLYMYEDLIPCADCQSKTVVGYHMCTDCGYSFRTTNGRFLDGSYPVEMEDVLKNLAQDLGFDDAAGCDGCTGCDNTSLLDSLFHCVKCGRPLVLSPNTVDYSCPHCGFEWEVLNGE